MSRAIWQWSYSWPAHQHHGTTTITRSKYLQSGKLALPKICPSSRMGCMNVKISKWAILHILTFFLKKQSVMILVILGLPMNLHTEDHLVYYRQNCTLFHQRQIIFRFNLINYKSVTLQSMASSLWQSSTLSVGGGGLKATTMALIITHTTIFWWKKQKLCNAYLFNCFNITFLLSNIHFM